MFMTEKEDENFYFNNLSLDYDESISLFNKKDNSPEKIDFRQKESKNSFTTFFVKKVIKKKEVHFLKQKTNLYEGKKEMILPLKHISHNINLINNLIDNNRLDISSDILYRKDAYYKHFKVDLGKYIKNRMNILKNKCFPYYNRNNFSTPNYKYTGNPKEKDNLNFLTFTIKDILIYGKDKEKYNRQYNNEQLINFIENNESRANDKAAYREIIQFLNLKLQDAIGQYYDDEKEFNKIKKDKKYIYFDKFFQRETGISLLEKYGFLKALKKNNFENISKFIYILTLEKYF